MTEYATASMPRTPTALPPILSEDVISFTECRGKLGEYMEKTRRTHRPIVVTQNGRPTSVLLNIVDWEQRPVFDDDILELLMDVKAAEEEAKRGELTSQADFIEELRAEGRL